MKKKLILVCGDLAAGKSTYANRIAKKYNILCINKDNFKEILGDNFPFRNREENLKLSMATFDLFKYIALKSFEVEVPLIIESNFRQHELDYLNTLAQKYDYDILSIIIRADIKVLHQRFMNRILNENRHPVHKSVDFSHYEDFEKQIKGDREREYPGSILYLDSTDFSNLNDSVINEKIKVFMC